jgi:hypothetical protein
MQSDSPTALSLDRSPGLIDLGSANGERRAERRRVEKVVGYPPLSELGDLQRREFHGALLEAATFEDLPGRWQAAILEAEQDGRRCASLPAISSLPLAGRRGVILGRAQQPLFRAVWVFVDTRNL